MIDGGMVRLPFAISKHRAVSGVLIDYVSGKTSLEAPEQQERVAVCQQDDISRDDMSNSAAENAVRSSKTPNPAPTQRFRAVQNMTRPFQATL
jgi:hypothetical protein